MKNLQNKIKKFPDSPGVYLMKDSAGEVIYIGKAINLKERVASYFGKGKDTRLQIGALVKRTRDIEYITAKSEKEALLLEYELIQKYKPRYNIVFKDDKSYAKIKINSNHKFPGIYITRRVLKDGSTYFGPHPSATSCRATVDLMIKYFKIRNCSNTFFANRSRPCVQYEIDRCTAPCVGYIGEDKYRKQIEATILFLNGKTSGLIEHLRKEMKAASEIKDYEKAAHLRDVVRSIGRVVDDKCRGGVSQECRNAGTPEQKAWNPIALTLSKKLRIPIAPRIIECVDISNISGKYAVGSVVVFANGKPYKNGYRRFKIKTGNEPDDYKMMKEVIYRRFKAFNETLVPDLILIDGGKGHLMIAKRVLDDLKNESISLASIAKGEDRKQDQVFILGRKNPVKFRKNDPAYLFLQRIRDEAHRFGIEYYRKRHRKGLITSELDKIPGIGPTKRNTLLKKFGSIKGIKEATEAEIAQTASIGIGLAKKIRKSLY